MARLFADGARVRRIESDNPKPGATVLSAHEDPDGWVYEIQYDEGGSGFWPESTLAPLE